MTRSKDNDNMIGLFMRMDSMEAGNDKHGTSWGFVVGLCLAVNNPEYAQRVIDLYLDSAPGVSTEMMDTAINGLIGEYPL